MYKHPLPLFATSIQNDRKMRPIHSVIQNIRFYCRNPGEGKNLNFHDGPLSFHLTSAGRSAQCGQIGRHCLAGISKGHRGNSNFFLPLAPYTYHGPLSTGIREDAFFQYLIQIQARMILDDLYNKKLKKLKQFSRYLVRNTKFLHLFSFFATGMQIFVIFCNGNAIFFIYFALAMQTF